jgi:hypothetical protein
VCFILFLVYKTTQVHKESVQKNYFYEELKYNRLSEEFDRWDALQISAKVENNMLKVLLPDSLIKSNRDLRIWVRFKLLSDEKGDTLILAKGSKESIISLNAIPHKEYMVEIELKPRPEETLARNRFKLRYPWKQS